MIEFHRSILRKWIPWANSMGKIIWWGGQIVNSSACKGHPRIALDWVHIQASAEQRNWVHPRIRLVPFVSLCFIKHPYHKCSIESSFERKSGSLIILLLLFRALPEPRKIGAALTKLTQLDTMFGWLFWKTSFDSSEGHLDHLRCPFCTFQ